MTIERQSGWIVPDWPAPARVRALSTTRRGGVSVGLYGLADGSPGGLNLGTHVGDDPSAVAENCRRLAAHLPAMPRWLEQVSRLRRGDRRWGGRWGRERCTACRCQHRHHARARLRDHDGGLPASAAVRCGG